MPIILLWDKILLPDTEAITRSGIERLFDLELQFYIFVIDRSGTCNIILATTPVIVGLWSPADGFLNSAFDRSTQPLV